MPRHLFQPYKYLLCVITTVFFIYNAQAQSSAYNYIVTYTPRVPVTAANTLQTATVANVNQTVQYFDGLGRPIQVVQTKGSPSQRDVVQIIAYDQYDREAVKYLPYSDTATSTGYGNFKTTAFAAQAAFYANPTATMWNAPGVVTTPFPTSNTGFEASPLNRVLEQGFAGDNWQLTGTSGATSPGHTVKAVYACNNTLSTASQASYWARHFAVQFSLTMDGHYTYTNRLLDSGGYQKNLLYVTVTHNENWSSTQSDTTLNTTQEYKDKFGQVLLRRTFNFNTYTGVRELLSTYYVYDEYGRLTYVLPPSAKPDSGSVSQRKLDNLCYQYLYDGRGRLIMKKIPGRGWDIMIYNNLNQVIGTQDSTNRMAHPQRVLYTKYDSQGRVIATGYYPITGSTSGTNYWSTLQANADAETHYWETKSSSGTYTSATIPTSGYTALVTKYYDDYVTSGLPAAYVVTSGVTTMTRNMLTASKTGVLNQPADMLWDVMYYDSLGRNVKSYSQHYLGGHSDYSANNYDLVTNYFNFVNQLDTVIRAHYTKANTDSAKVTIGMQYTYDHVGRKRMVNEQFFGRAGTGQTPVSLSSTLYNEIGQVTEKEYHLQSGMAGYLNTVNYSYNERGWLTALTPTGTHYSEVICYNRPSGTATKQFNGNISQFRYNSQQLNSTITPAIADTVHNTISYTYDNLNRLTKSTSTFSKNDETIRYDLEGNILTIARNGAHNSNYTLTYPGQSNQLSTAKNSTFTARSFGYDANGNTRTDSVLTIHYNLLNLPDTVKSGGTIVTTYYYDASGKKLRNVSKSGDGTWDYIYGIVYHDINIDFISTEEGRAYLEADSIYHYNYDLRDYLGNVRASYQPGAGNSLQYIQENDYYPFGLASFQWISGQESRYLYNGKEKQVDVFNMLDYGARFYDPVIPRWISVDPLAGKSSRWSPYNYGSDNSIINIDPDGMDDFDYNQIKFTPQFIWNANEQLQNQLIYAGQGGNDGSNSNNDNLPDVYFDDKTKDKSGAKRVTELINLGLGGDYASIDELGKLSLSVSVDQLAGFTDEQREFYNILENAINDPRGDINIDINSDSPNAPVASWLDGVIDISDIEKFGQVGTGADEFSVFAHEFREQQEKQLNPGPKGEFTYKRDHQQGIEAEEKMKNNTRTSEKTAYFEDDRGGIGGITGLQKFTYRDNSTGIVTTITIQWEHGNITGILRQ